MLSIHKCREILKDYESPDNVIQNQRDYLYGLCRMIIRETFATFHTSHASQQEVCNKVAIQKSQNGMYLPVNV
jgi:hypothetical protein